MCIDTTAKLIAYITGEALVCPLRHPYLWLYPLVTTCSCITHLHCPSSEKKHQGIWLLLSVFASGHQGHTIWQTSPGAPSSAYMTVIMKYVMKKVTIINLWVLITQSYQAQCCSGNDNGVHPAYLHANYSLNENEIRSKWKKKLNRWACKALHQDESLTDSV